MTTIPSRGGFTFTAPYNTQGIRITNESDGTILPRTYSYWSNTNAHLGRDKMRVFLGTSLGPCWWEIDKCSYEVTPMGPIFPPGHPLAANTAEGWYWSDRDPNILFCSDDFHLYRYSFDVNSLTRITDLTQYYWMGSDRALRQWHTDGSGKIHSATVKQIVPEGAWPNLGTVVVDENKSCASQWRWFPKIGDMDEAQIDKSGLWLLSKENTDGLNDEDNRIFNLTTGAERIILDQNGAGGHSDNGYGYMVHADNWQSLATWRVTMFDPALTPQGRVVLTTTWEEQVIHASHCNARPGSVDSQIVLGSGTIPDIVTFPLSGSGALRHLAPSMSAGGDYDNLPKANLDPHGQFALWTRYAGRFDAFMVKL